MTTVWKYDVPTQDEFELDMPIGAKILSFQIQQESGQMWVLVSPNAPLVKRKFRLAGTGHPIDHDESNLKFVGTVQLLTRSLVFHLFEVSR